jgi:hypothetical protein
LLFAICYLPFAICHLLFAICHPLSSLTLWAQSEHLQPVDAHSEAGLGFGRGDHCADITALELNRPTALLADDMVTVVVGCRGISVATVVGMELAYQP